MAMAPKKALYLLVKWKQTTWGACSSTEWKKVEMFLDVETMSIYQTSSNRS